MFSISFSFLDIYKSISCFLGSRFHITLLHCLPFFLEEVRHLWQMWVCPWLCSLEELLSFTLMIIHNSWRRYLFTNQMVGYCMAEINLLNQSLQSHMLIILTTSLKMTRNRYSFLGTTHDIKDVLKYLIFPNTSNAKEATLIWDTEVSTPDEVYNFAISNRMSK